MKRPKPNLKTRSKAKPPTIRQVLGRLESRILAAESALKQVAQLRQDINHTLEKIETQDQHAAKSINTQLATLRNQVENLRDKLDGGGVAHRINELHTGMSGLVIQAANKALVLLIQELERMGLKPQ